MSVRGVIAACVAGAVGIATAYDVARGQDERLLRPPGSPDEKRFSALCVKCGKCILACPYQAVGAAPISAGASVGTPKIDTRAQACRLCEDFPCADTCPTGALAVPESRRAVRMGTAVIDEGLCLSYQAMRCEVCYRACPLIDEAIYINYQSREGDAIHAVFAPVVVPEACVGCGLCVQRCPVDSPHPAIRIEPSP